MKTLENNVLLYDCDCPMCNLYSVAFIKTGMLDEQGRLPFHQMTEPVKSIIDVDRSRNEIALIDTKKQTVIYGLDSLLFILGHNFPFIKTIFRFSPLYWLMKKIYFFISYNRKVIAPSRTLNPVGACTPDYNVKYRWAFIVVSTFLVAWLLHLYFGNISFVKSNTHGFVTEWFIALGQLFVQGLLVYRIRKNRLLDYLGHNMVISLIGALLLIPAIVFAERIIAISEWVYLGYFAIPVLIMLWQHVRRVKILELPWGLTLSWLLYRAFIAGAFIIINYEL